MSKITDRIDSDIQRRMEEGKIKPITPIQSIKNPPSKNDKTKKKSEFQKELDTAKRKQKEKK